MRIRGDLGEPASWWQYLLRRAGSYFGGLVIVSVVAWCVGMPLAAYHFNRITPWGALNSVVLAPVVFLTLMVGFGKLLVAAVLPSAAGLLSWPLETLGQAVVWLARQLVRLPGSAINTASEPIWLMVLFYGLLGLAAWALRWARDLLGYALALVVIWLVVFFWLVPFREIEAGDMVVHVLAVGHGTAVVVELPDGKIICCDAGSMSGAGGQFGGGAGVFAEQGGAGGRGAFCFAS